MLLGRAHGDIRRQHIWLGVRERPREFFPSLPLSVVHTYAATIPPLPRAYYYSDPAYYVRTRKLAAKHRNKLANTFCYLSCCTGVPKPELSKACLRARHYREQAKSREQILWSILETQYTFWTESSTHQAIDTLIEAIRAWHRIDSNRRVLLIDPFGIPLAYVPSPCGSRQY